MCFDDLVNSAAKDLLLFQVAILSVICSYLNACGENGRELAAFPNAGINFNKTAHRLNQTSRNRQAQTHSALRLAAFGREEGIENVRQNVFCDARTLVGNGHADLTVRIFNLNRHRRRTWRSLDGIADQVVENLFDFTFG